jgi:hypothetical protein
MKASADRPHITIMVPVIAIAQPLCAEIASKPSMWTPPQAGWSSILLTNVLDFLTDTLLLRNLKAHSTGFLWNVSRSSIPIARNLPFPLSLTISEFRFLFSSFSF